MKNVKFISYSQQTYASMIVKLSLQPKMVLPHHAGKFCTSKQRFFLHDFTLIASVMGVSVIGHGIGGKDIPAKMS